MIVAETFHIDQAPIRNRLIVSIPIFIASALMLWFNIADKDGFNTIWKYFGWANQTLAVFTLWALTVFLAKKRSGMKYLVTLVPAAFMTAVCSTFILVDKVGFGISAAAAPWLGMLFFFGSAGLFAIWKIRQSRKDNPIQKTQ